MHQTRLQSNHATSIKLASPTSRHFRAVVPTSNRQNRHHVELQDTDTVNMRLIRSGVGHFSDDLE